MAIAVENALASARSPALKDKLAREKLYLEDEIRTEHDFDEIVGERRPLLRACSRRSRRSPPTDATVLISGETGTGKELIARAIHERSRRRDAAVRQA